MATKALHGAPIYATTRSTSSGALVTGLAQPTTNNTFFDLGDTAFYNLNGVNVPVVVRSIQVSGDASLSPDDAVYTVVGAVGSAGMYPRGVTRGPFRDVPASLLSTR